MADPGRLRELLLEGKRVWLLPASNPARKTRWSAVLVESPGGDKLVSLDSTLPNRLIRRALEDGALEEFEGWSLAKAEFAMGRSRFDFLLSNPNGRRMVVEVKSVTLVEESVGLFPDAVTERGARHVAELAEIPRRPDWEASVLFVLQRSDAREIRAAKAIDPKFASTLQHASDAGVRILGRRCRVLFDRLELGGAVPAGVG
jgi:sugar fermentation stimulation protein A